MKVILSFDSSVATSACTGVSACSAYGETLSGAVYTPTGAYDLITGYGGSIVPDEAYRTYYLDFPILSAGNYRNGTYVFVAESTGASAAVVINTDETVRNFKTLVDLELLRTLISGSQVVNTTLNELVYYADTINSDGSVSGSGAKSTLLLRQKLYNAEGQGTSINPVERRTYNSTLETYQNTIASGTLSAYQ